MGKLPFLALFHALILFVAFFCQFSIEVETITPNNSISKGETLVCSGKSFEFGFFSPANSKNNYLAIWYKKTPEIVVWTANRENPVTDPKGVLFTISTNGTLLLLNQTNGVIWSSSSSKEAESPVIRLLDSGNLVLQETVTNGSGSHLWESFDYPSKTWLPGMKIGGGLKNRYLVSWKNLDDPSSGEWTLVLKKGKK
nr:S-locus-specific glycoprotein S13-like [Ziziphus jujuba var. spinosa]